jgi:hypothetical protein
MNRRFVLPTIAGLIASLFTPAFAREENITLREEHGIGWALRQVAEGRSVTRPGFYAEWIELNGDEPTASVWMQVGAQLILWVPTKADIEAKDWSVVPLD